MSREPGTPERRGARILVVDDEPAIRRVLRAVLTQHGFQVETADDGQQALRATERSHPDLLLLDLGLPDMDGVDVIRALRTWTSIPIVVLSVRSAERQKVLALESGADDYVTKPFGVAELLARVRVALRHAARPAAGSAARFRTGGLEVDLEHRRVCVDGQEVHLSPTEYALLKAFIAHPNKVLTDRMLLHQAWGPDGAADAHALHVYMARLRRKLEPDPQRPRYLRTEHGVGYRLHADDADTPPADRPPCARP